MLLFTNHFTTRHYGW